MKQRTPLLILLCAFSAATLTAISACGNNSPQGQSENKQPTSNEYFEFTYLSETDGYEIRAKGLQNIPAEVVLPYTYNGKPVTAIGDEAFDGCSHLKSITFGENSELEYIGDEAFYGCTNLTSITIPNSVESIGDYAFAGCGNYFSIIFNGTRAEWDAITKGSNWNTGFYGDINCTQEE